MKTKTLKTKLLTAFTQGHVAGVVSCAKEIEDLKRNLKSYQGSRYETITKLLDAAGQYQQQITQLLAQTRDTPRQ